MQADSRGQRQAVSTEPWKRYRQEETQNYETVIPNELSLAGMTSEDINRIKWKSLILAQDERWRRA